MEKVKLVFPVVAVRSGEDFNASEFEEALELMASGELSEDEVLSRFEDVKTPMLLVRWPSRAMQLPAEMQEELKLVGKPIPSVTIQSSVTGAALAGLDVIAERLAEGKMTGIEIEFSVENLKFTRTHNYIRLSPDSIDLDTLVDIEPIYKCSLEADEAIQKRARLLNRLNSMKIRANTLGTSVVTPSGNIVPGQGTEEKSSAVAENVNPF